MKSLQSARCELMPASPSRVPETARAQLLALHLVVAVALARATAARMAATWCLMVGDQERLASSSLVCGYEMAMVMRCSKSDMAS